MNQSFDLWHGQMEQLRMELEVAEELVSLSDQRHQELSALHKEMIEELQTAQDTIYQKDKALWTWNGVERELKKMDLESLHDLESNMISSLQSVRKVIAKKNENEFECRVCMDRKKDTVIVPCGHCLCSNCVLRVEKCPMCRSRIERFIKLR